MVFKSLAKYSINKFPYIQTREGYKLAQYKMRKISVYSALQ